MIIMLLDGERVMQERICCSIRLSSKPCDLAIRTYIRYRSSNNLRGNMFLQGLISLAMQGKQPPVIAKIHPDETLPSSECRKFTILRSNLYYDTLAELPQAFCSNLIYNTLKASIQIAGLDEEEWFMPEVQLSALGICDTVSKAIEPHDAYAGTVKMIKEPEHSKGTQTRIKVQADIEAPKQNAIQESKKSTGSESSKPQRLTFGLDGY